MTKPYSPHNVGIEGFCQCVLGGFVREGSHAMFVVMSVLQGPVRAPVPEPQLVIRGGFRAPTFELSAWDEEASHCVRRLSSLACYLAPFKGPCEYTAEDVLQPYIDLSSTATPDRKSVV